MAPHGVALSTDNSSWVNPDCAPVAVVRALIEAAFTPQTLRRFCADRPAFRPVLNRLGVNEGLVDSVDRLLDYCGEYLLWETLLEEVAAHNPQQYARFEPRLRAVDEAGPGTPSVSLRPGTPFQAPAAVSCFVGRGSEITTLCSAIAAGQEPSRFCITGMGGIGKTALAIHLAHGLRTSFADGVLWANVAHSEPLAILDSWARAYGHDFGSLPDLYSRAAALRGVLAARQVLVVLDDVPTADTVRPLLPGGPRCVTLITTRNAELAAALDAVECRLSTLQPTESRQLLEQIVGQERLAGAREEGDQIAELLGHLPLAVHIAAHRLALHRRWRPADLVSRLRDETTRLDELKLSDKEVRASFSLSWEDLSEPLRRSFALQALFDGRAFLLPAFAALAGLDTWSAEDHLYALIARSLLVEEEQGSFRQHPLLAAFAGEMLGDDEAAEERYVRYYLGLAAAGGHDYETLDLEWDNLGVAARLAFSRGWWQAVIDYAALMADAWFTRGHFSEARQACDLACQATERLGDQRARMANLNRWGRACIEQCDYAEATEHLSVALDIGRSLEDRAGMAEALTGLGRIALEQSEFEAALPLLTESRALREQMGDGAGVAHVLFFMSTIRYYRQDFAAAEEMAIQALALAQKAGDGVATIHCLGLLADIVCQVGDGARAERYIRHGLELADRLQEQGERAILLRQLARVYLDSDNLPAARQVAMQSLAAIRRMGDRKSEARILFTLTKIDAGLADYGAALHHAGRSLDLCRELDDAWGSVYVLSDLGQVYQAMGEPGEARRAWRQALDIARRLDHPLVDVLHSCLASEANPATATC
ncbi:MAG: tetratricopeptide repeat protein [Anaerolineae bacterium]|nr:tetratricopeptide repeat protein [Anaerolineae bacterium]